MFINRFRLQETNKESGGGGGGDWRASFGAEAAPVLKDFKEPGEFFKAFNERSTELTTLKSAQPKEFNWRDAAATIEGKKDEAIEKALARYTDLPSVSKALLEAQKKISSGELAKPLAKDAKPEEIAAWRAANGIPADQKEYWKGLPEGLVIGADDQPVFDAYGAIAHKHNAPPALMHDFAKAYFDAQTEVAKAERAVDQQDAVKTTEVLKAKWGNEYDVNMNILDSHLDGLPKDLKAMFKDATLGDGTRLFNSPEVMQFMVATARAANPLAHLLPSGGEGNMASFDLEFKGLQKMMRDKNSEYHKGPNAAKNQARYRQLIEINDQMKKKSA